MADTENNQIKAHQTRKTRPERKTTKRAEFIWLFKQGFHTWLHIKVGYFLFLVSRMINMWGKAEHIFFLKFHRKVKCPPFFNTHPQLTCEEFLLDTFSLPVLTVDWFSHCSIRLRHNNKKNTFIKSIPQSFFNVLTGLVFISWRQDRKDRKMKQKYQIYFLFDPTTAAVTLAEKVQIFSLLGNRKVAG